MDAEYQAFISENIKALSSFARKLLITATQANKDKVPNVREGIFIFPGSQVNNVNKITIGDTVYNHISGRLSSANYSLNHSLDRTSLQPAQEEFILFIVDLLQLHLPDCIITIAPPNSTTRFYALSVKWRQQQQ